MSRSRFWRIVLFSVAGIAAVLLVGGWAYLNSAAATRQVAAALSDALGSPVEMDGASIGLGHTELRNIRVPDPNAPDGAPWMKVQQAEVALPLLSAVFGDRQPREVTLHQPSITLRLDKDGNVLTGLPESKGGVGGSVPPVKVQDGELTLIQDGEGDRQFHGINAALVSKGRSLHLDGGINDPEWGQWSLGGDLDLNSHKGTGWLATQTRDVSMPYLKRIPFVPSSVWEAVQLEGKTPARAEFTYDPAARVPFSYRVDLDPVNTNVSVTSVDLRATAASGHVTVDNGVVTLRGVNGQTAGGTLSLDAELDFRDRHESRMHFKAAAKGLQVRELPPSWGLPKDLSGRLTGEANLEVIVTEHGTTTSGTGRAVITGVKFGELAADPIVLTLHPAGRGFRFRQDPKDTPPAGKGSPAPTGEDKPPPPPPPPPAKEAAAPKKAERNEGFIGGLPALALRWIGYLLQQGDANPEGRTYLTINLGLTDVDVAQALKQLHMQVPVTLAGRVTFRLTADVPTDSPNDYKSYRLRGTVTSKRLEVEGVPIEDLAVRADVRNGILRLDEFTGRSPPASPNKGGSAGSFTGSGEMRLADAYPFRAKLNISGLDLTSAGRTGAALPVPVQGVLNGSANLEGTLTPTAIRGSGRIKATNARIGVVPVGELDLNVTADGDRIKVDGAHAALLGGEVTANAVLPVRNDVAGKAVVELKGVDVGELAKQLPRSVNVQLSGKASGTVTATIPAKRGNEPRRVDADVNISAPELRLQNFPVENVKGSATYADGRLKFKLSGALAGGGTLDASGEYLAPPPKSDEQPKEPPGPGLTGSVRIEGLRLSRLRRELKLPRSLEPLEGEAGFELNYHVAGGEATGLGSLHVDRVTWGGREVVSRIRAVARLTENQLRLERLAFPLGAGEVTGLVQINLEAIDHSRLVLTARGVPAETLLALLPGQTGAATGAVDVHVRTTLGRLIRGHGTITLATGTVAGAPARDVRVPLEWNVSSAGSGDLHIHGVSGTVAQGRLKGSATLTLFGDTPPRLNGDLQFTNLNLHTLSSATESVSGTSQVTGRFDFASDRFRSANDLNGTLFATLGQAQPFQLPVLSNILPFVGNGRSNQSTTRKGEVRATLAGGVFRVQHFSLSGNSLDLFGDGIVTVAGNLNLNVTVSTHPLPIDPLVLRLLGIRIPVTVGPVPVGLIVTISTYLSNRVIHLSVTGNLRSPTVRVQALQTLSENAVRFFLEQSLFPVPAAAVPAP